MPLQPWLRYHIKLALAASLYFSGMLRLMLRWRLRGRGLVLLYHRVLPESDRSKSGSSGAIIVTPETFDRHLRFLQRHFSVLGPDEFNAWRMGHRQTPRPPCLITFDDGWKDNYTHAYPLLKSHRLPAVIFLPTDYIGTGNLFWQEELTHLLLRLGQRPERRGDAIVDQYGLDPLFSGAGESLAERAGTLARSYKNRDWDEVQRMIRDLRSTLQEVEGTTRVDAYLNWNEVDELRANRISFGSHAVSHRILTQLSPTEVAQELAASKTILENRLGTTVDLLAYPNGNHDHETCRQASLAGYQLAFTTVSGRVTRQDDPMRLRRINIHNGAHRHLPLFCASILGVF